MKPIIMERNKEVNKTDFILFNRDSEKNRYYKNDKAVVCAFIIIYFSDDLIQCGI